MSRCSVGAGSNREYFKLGCVINGRFYTKINKYNYIYHRENLLKEWINYKKPKNSFKRIRETLKNKINKLFIKSAVTR